RLVLNRLIHLATMHRDVFRSLDPQAHLVATDFDDGHRDVVVDDDALVLLAGENQHRRSSLMSKSKGGDPLGSEVPVSWWKAGRGPQAATMTTYNCNGATRWVKWRWEFSQVAQTSQSSGMGRMRDLHGRSKLPRSRAQRSNSEA